MVLLNESRLMRRSWILDGEYCFYSALNHLSALLSFLPHILSETMFLIFCLLGLFWYGAIYQKSWQYVSAAKTPAIHFIGGVSKVLQGVF